MDLRFGVASRAFLGYAPEDFLLMAICAVDLGVRAVQWEDLGVIEIAQPVDAVVAIQASRAELFLVFPHKFGFLFILWAAGFTAVAGRANLQVEGLEARVRMAALAGDRFAGVIFCVPLEAESGQRSVLERLPFPVRW